MKKFISLAALLMMAVLSFAQADAILGNYEAIEGGNGSRIKIFKQGDTYAGQIYWLSQPNDESGKPKTDIKNPDKSKRNNPVIGLIMIKDLKYDAKENKWVGGTIYNPHNGKSYKSQVKFADDGKTLNVRGYIGIPALGETRKWKKIN